MGSGLDCEGLPQLSTLLFGCRLTSAMGTYPSPDTVAATTAMGRVEPVSPLISGAASCRSLQAAAWLPLVPGVHGQFLTFANIC